MTSIQHLGMLLMRFSIVCMWPPPACMTTLQRIGNPSRSCSQKVCCVSQRSVHRRYQEIGQETWRGP
ncbi:hypothetical protein GDO81_018500 [Engystomops pustulosus]|uniref:Secreted protein n=1 Tax=Engystomops pustulosus TaxID=76066 RepID=A0AAV6YBT4_ENGPU|nr:hypothetical protein GDO81_018500 [Engystomops pustulosus]